MRKVCMAALVCAGWAFQANAYSGQGDISKVKEKNDFSGTFGVQYITGLDADNLSQTDFESGRVQQVSLGLDYTFADDWTLLFTTDNNYSDSQIGVQWAFINNKEFGLDFITDYGIAWTKDAATDARFGMNNFDAGFLIHGTTWRNVQWSVQAMGQFVFANPQNFWNINFTGQSLYYFRDDMATLVQFDYNILQIDAPKTLYDRTINVGLMYNISETSSLNPFVEYHFLTENGEDNLINSQNYWEIGAQWSVGF